MQETYSLEWKAGIAHMVLSQFYGMLKVKWHERNANEEVVKF